MFFQCDLSRNERLRQILIYSLLAFGGGDAHKWTCVDLLWGLFVCLFVFGWGSSHPCKLQHPGSASLCCRLLLYLSTDSSICSVELVVCRCSFAFEAEQNISLRRNSKIRVRVRVSSFCALCTAMNAFLRSSEVYFPADRTTFPGVQWKSRTGPVDSHPQLLQHPANKKTNRWSSPPGIWPGWNMDNKENNSEKSQLVLEKNAKMYSLQLQRWGDASCTLHLFQNCRKIRMFAK